MKLLIIFGALATVLFTDDLLVLLFDEEGIVEPGIFVITIISMVPQLVGYIKVLWWVLISPDISETRYYLVEGMALLVLSNLLGAVFTRIYLLTLYGFAGLTTKLTLLLTRLVALGLHLWWLSAVRQFYFEKLKEESNHSSSPSANPVV